MIIDQHQPIVEKYYGAGNMQSVIKRLLEECDRVVRSTLEAWREDRSIKRKVENIPFPCSLTESFPVVGCLKSNGIGVCPAKTNFHYRRNGRGRST